MTDNGAKALAERLYTLVSVEDHGQLCPVWTRRKHPAEKAECDCWVQPQSAERADAILATGAVFLTAEEVERLRTLDVERLARFVLEHGVHSPFCTYTSGGQLCDCGLVVAMTEARAALTEPSP